MKGNIALLAGIICAGWIASSSPICLGTNITAGQPLQFPPHEKIRSIAIEGNYDDAIALAQKELQQHPENVDVRLVLGQIYTWQGEYNLAKTQFELILNDKPSYLDARLALTNIAIWTKDYALANRLITAGLKLIPHQPELIKDSLLVEELSSKPKAAEQILQNLLEPEKGDRPFGTYEFLQQMAISGKRAEAIEEAKTLIANEPDSYMLRVLLGRFYAWDGQIAKAKEQFNGVLKEDPEYTEAAVGLIDLALWDKDYKTALALTQKALSTDPDSSDLLYHLSLIYQRTDQTEKAKTTLASLLRLNPNHKDGRNLLSSLQSQQIRKPAALQSIPTPLINNSKNNAGLQPETVLLVKAKPTISYQQVRYLAFHDQREKAKQLALKSIETAPPNYDMRILLGRMYYWDSNYIEARGQFAYVLKYKPHYTDALIGLIDVETREKNTQRALQLDEMGLSNEPNHLDLLYHKALLLRNLGRPDEARKILMSIARIDPNYADVRSLLEKAPGAAQTGGPVTYPNQLEYIREFNDLSDLKDPWKYATVNYTRVTPLGSIVARVNHSNRFNITGEQYEIDAYPSIKKGLYAYLNYGYSGATSLFPRDRYGAELFKMLPHSFEASLGLRHLSFANSNTTIYTSSIAKYLGNYYFALRLYTSPQTRSWSHTYQFRARKFFADPNFYTTITLSHGTSPGGGLGDIPEDVDVATSSTCEYDIKIPIAKHFYVKCFVGYSNQLLTNRRKRKNEYVGGGIGALF